MIHEWMRVMSAPMKFSAEPRARATRMIVGCQVSTSLRTDLALDALDMGLWARERAGQDVAGRVHHNDRGVQYRAMRYTEPLAFAPRVKSDGCARVRAQRLRWAQ